MTQNELKRLLDDMSLDEKLGELQQLSGHLFSRDSLITGVVTQENLTEKDLKYCGSVINICSPEEVVRIQKEHLENHPHKIPLLFMADIIHGHSTIFPIPLAQGCSFDPSVAYDIAKNTAKESCVSGVSVTFSPMVDLVRDARWGRVMESTGEDPYLNCLMAEATVKGYQGDDMSKKGKISACVKHYAAYGAVEGGREYASTDLSERTLRQYYLPSYKAACDAKSGMLMTAFTAIGGEPTSGSKKLLTDILRNEWGYDGTVISDYGSIRTMKSHAISDSDTELAKIAVDGNIDVEMCSYCYRNGIPQLLKDGRMTTEELDKLVMRVLNLKNRLGLFENPYHFVDPKEAAEICESSDILYAARDIIPKTSVLLKNEDNILPLSPGKDKLAFIGPFTDDSRILGGWVHGGIKRRGAKTVKQAVSERYSDLNIMFEKGSNMIGSEDRRTAEFHGFTCEINDDNRQKMLESAIATAKNADRVVMFIGEHPGTGGELNSKADITIPDIQKDLFKAVHSVNKNIIVVLFNHRPLDIREISDKAKAILDVWFPGTMGADAVLDMLFGISAPSGKLSMSFPYCVGQEPIYYNCLPTDHSPEFESHFVTGYIDCPLEPLYSFGEGLTYTEFEYGSISLDSDKMTKDGEITAKINVKNIGQRDGIETVQLYIRDRYASISRPLKELKGIKKLHLKAGEEKTVEFKITSDMLKFYNTDLEYVCEPGEFNIFIGQNSKTWEFVSFNLI